VIALVLGASSQIGHCLLPLLQAEGIEVLALSRQSVRGAPADVRWLQGALPAPLPPLPPLRYVFSSGPLDALAAWLPTAPLAVGARVLATSSMSALSKQDSPLAAERALSARLRGAEQALAQICAQRGVGCTVLRPTLIYGVGRDRSLTPLARRARRTRVFALPQGRGLRQPVHAADVARALLVAALRAQPLDALLEFGGGERLSAAQMFARVRASLPFATLGVPLPRALLVLAALHPALRGPITRLDQDLIADNARAVAALGVTPRAFRPDACCWAL
jgi:nucleoside-diphosphate-sugar epimerase